MNMENKNILTNTSKKIGDVNTQILELKRLMNEKWKYNSNRIYFLKTYLRIIIDILSQINNFSFTDDEKNEMCNECICYYLLISLENAQNAKQTVYSFAKQKYTLKAKQKRHKTGEDILTPEPSHVASLYRGLDAYNANIKLESQTQKNRSKSKNFIELCYFDSFSNYSLDLYRTLMYRKKPLQTTTNTKEESAISKGYNEYFSFLKNLYKEENNTFFTVKSLFFLKFESTLRFLFAYQVAEYSINNKVPISDDVVNNLLFYYARMEFDSLAKGTSISSLHRQNEEIITRSFNAEHIENIQRKIYVARMIMFDALSMYIEISPFRIDENWDIQDFNNASAFLREDYKVTNIF